MVPLYETRGDRLHEKRVAEMVGEAWGVGILRLPELSRPGDYLLHDEGRLLGIIEIKRRTTAHDKYDTFMLSASKVEQMMLAIRALHTDAWIIIEFTDGIFYCTAKTMAAGVLRTGGRYDRNDSTAVELLHHIDHNQLTRIL